MRAELAMVAQPVGSAAAVTMAFLDDDDGQ